MPAEKPPAVPRPSPTGREATGAYKLLRETFAEARESLDRTSRLAEEVRGSIAARRKHLGLAVAEE